MRLFLFVCAAFLYDLLILAALTLVLTAFFTLIAQADFNDSSVLRPLFQVSWLAVIFAYFGVSYAYGGQTIGMRAWKLIAVAENTQPLSKRQAIGRVFASLFNVPLLGLGWLGYLTKSQKSLTDVLSRTSLQRINKKT